MTTGCVLSLAFGMSTIFLFPLMYTASVILVYFELIECHSLNQDFVYLLVFIPFYEDVLNYQPYREQCCRSILKDEEERCRYRRSWRILRCNFCVCLRTLSYDSRLVVRKSMPRLPNQ
jgi:hypothetical protein